MACGVCSSATTKTRHVIIDFDVASEIITFEQNSFKLAIVCTLAWNKEQCKLFDE